MRRSALKGRVVMDPVLLPESNSPEVFDGSFKVINDKNAGVRPFG
jgi:hypothetical protein